MGGRKRALWEDTIGIVPAPPTSWVKHVHSRTPGLEEAIAQINLFERPLRLGTPCSGFEAPVFALRQLGVRNFEHSFSIDIAPHAATFGANLRRAGSSIYAERRRAGRSSWFGQREGDLL